MEGTTTCWGNDIDRRNICKMIVRKIFFFSLCSLRNNCITNRASSFILTLLRCSWNNAILTVHHITHNIILWCYYHAVNREVHIRAKILEPSKYHIVIFLYDTVRYLPFPSETFRIYVVLTPARSFCTSRRPTTQVKDRIAEKHTTPSAESIATHKITFHRRYR